MNNKKLQYLIYKQLDSQLSDSENEELAKLFSESDEAEATYKDINRLRSTIKKSYVGAEFNPFFEERILSKIKSFEKENFSILDFATQMTASFKNISVAAIAVLVLLIVFNVVNGNIYSIQNIFNSHDTSLEYAFNPLQNYFGKQQ